MRMARVTSKLQVTIPRRLARECGIEPGAEIDWAAAGEGIRITPANRVESVETGRVEQRLALFDRATERQKKRQRNRSQVKASERGWAREDLYERGRTR